MRDADCASDRCFEPCGERLLPCALKRGHEGGHLPVTLGGQKPGKPIHARDAAIWLVQRRLPGVQGENGCWSDYEPVEAADAREAMQKVADGEHDHMLHAEFRVQPMPEFETFRPEVERTSTRSVRV